MHTEQQAKEKWCPMARDSETAGNRSQQYPEHIAFNCLGSECMFWRWGPDSEDGIILEEAGDALNTEKWETPGVGYCGAGGRDG